MISKKLFPVIIFIYFFQYVSERNYFNFQKVSKKIVLMHHPSIKKSVVKFGLVMNEKTLETPQQGSSYTVHCCPSFWICLSRLVDAHGKFSPLLFSLISDSNSCVLVSVAQQVSKTTTTQLLLYYCMAVTDTNIQGYFKLERSCGNFIWF